MNKANYWDGRKILREENFDVPGAFESMWAAEKWIKDNGYSCGSPCRGEPIAIRKGEYDLPQKWKNFNYAEKKSVDGVLLTSFREGAATILIFE